jgi:hypothetical protein
MVQVQRSENQGWGMGEDAHPNLGI